MRCGPFSDREQSNSSRASLQSPYLSWQSCLGGSVAENCATWVLTLSWLCWCLCCLSDKAESRSMQFQDLLYGRICLPEWLEPFLKIPEFVRLRGVRLSNVDSIEFK